MPTDTARSPAALVLPRMQRAYRWYVVFVLHCAYLVFALNIRIFSLVLEPVRIHFAASDTAMGMMIGLGFALSTVIAGVLLGRRADRSARKPILGFSTFFIGCFGMLGGIVNAFYLLFISRMGVGAGIGGLQPATYSLISDYFSAKKRALALSIVITGNRLGGGIALLIGGVILGSSIASGGITIPFAASLAPWQAVLILAGIPGIIVSAILMLTVREPVRRDTGYSYDDSEGAGRGVPWKAIREYLASGRSTALLMAIVIGSYFFANVGTSLWMPTFLIRTYGWTPEQAGISFGLVLFFSSSTGTLFGGWLSLRLERAGYPDANIRVLLCALIGLLPLRLIYPFMPSGLLALVVLTPTLFMVSMPLGTLSAAIVNIFPNQMRATVVAMYILVLNVVGMGLGPTSIALVTDFVFRDPRALRYSIALVASCATAVTLYCTVKLLAPYRESLSRASLWHSEHP